MSHWPKPISAEAAGAIKNKIIKNMKKYISLLSFFLSLALSAQDTRVGVGTYIAEAQLHVKGENSDGDTKALKVENASRIEILSIANDGVIGLEKEPETSAGPYDLLVRNKNTGNLEKVSSAPSVEADPIWNQARVNTLTYKGNIPDISNLNNYTETGIFNAPTVATATTGINFPAPMNGKLEVFNYDNATYQTYITSDNRIFVRNRNGASWSAWKLQLEATGLEKLNQGSGAGWRLIGRDQALFQIIGENAVDFSLGGATNNRKGAGGKNSVAFQKSAATGEDSFATGTGFAQGVGSVAIMGGTARGYGSITFGMGSADGESSVNAFSSGGNARAWRSNLLIGSSGDETRGMFSTILSSSGNSVTTGMSSMIINGFSSTAKGTRSVAFGPRTHASAENEVVVGANSLEIAGTTGEGWVATDPAFRVGIGSGYTGQPHQKMDGLQIFKNGSARLPEASNEQIALDPKGIVTTEFLQEKLDGLPAPVAETDPEFIAQRPDIMIYRSSVPAGANLNSYAETGIYSIPADGIAFSGANFPLPKSGQLDVFTKDSQIFQKYISIDNKMFLRSQTGGIWTDWKSYINTGLEQVNENGVIGYRLAGRPAQYYYKAGFYSVDLSYGGSTRESAAGPFSFAAGFEPESKASATFIAGGYRNAANKDYAFSSGQNNVSEGYASFTSGAVNSAAGYYAFAGGYNNFANSVSEFSIGQYGTNRPGNAMVTVPTDRIFNIGIGGSVTLRKDALSVFKSGLVTLPGSTTTLIESNPKSVLTLDYYNSKRQDLDGTLGIGNTTNKAIVVEDNYFMAKHADEETDGDARVVIEPGVIRMTSTDLESAGSIRADNLSTAHEYQLPDQDGTFALKSDIEASVLKIGNSDEPDAANGYQTLFNTNTVVAFEEHLKFVEGDGANNRVAVLQLSDSVLNRINQPQALEATNEGNGTGYRIAGVNADNYGPIGKNAVDFSVQTTASTTRGATGENSFNIGTDNQTTGFGGFTGGWNNTNASTYGFTFGGGHSNAGYANSIFGYGNTVQPTANYTITSGRNNLNKSGASSTFGAALISTGAGAMVVGRANIELPGQIGSGGPRPNDPMFIVGNGTITNAYAATTRSNAFVVYGDGKVQINTAPPIDNNATLLYGRNADGTFSLVEKTPYKTFSALISQSSTNPIQATVTFENRVGTITYQRTAVGTYKLLIPSMPLNKAWWQVGPTGDYDIQVSQDSADAITITAKNSAGVLSDGAFTKTPIEIRIYN